MAIKVGEMIISVNLVFCNCDLLKYCHYFKRHLWKIYHFNKQFKVFGINVNIHVAIIPARLVKPQKMKKMGLGVSMCPTFWAVEKIYPHPPSVGNGKWGQISDCLDNSLYFFKVKCGTIPTYRRI